MAQIKSLQLTSAQVLALSSADQQILPAPPAGYAYEILRVQMIFNGGSTGYTSVGYLQVGGSAAPKNWWANGTYLSQLFIRKNIPPQFGEPQSIQTDVRVQSSAALVGGDAPLLVEVVYDLIPVL